MESTILTDLVFGGCSGILTGILVAPMEYLKVIMQTNKLNIVQSIQSDQSLKKMLKSIPQFSSICVVVLGLEFSVNERIKKNYGTCAGIVASALTGGWFLTAADHLMFRREKGEITRNTFKNLSKIGIFSLWTGFFPMIMREAIFMSSVTHLGPKFGRILKKLFDDSDTISITWNSIGRIFTGVICTFFSHPFDILARKMQINLFNNPEKKSSIVSCFKEIQQEAKSSNLKNINHPFFKGAIPRMGVVTFGGVFAGGFFEMFKRHFGYKLDH